MPNPDDLLQFGRVIYIEPNNNILGGNGGSNFTFKPEDYSILVDLQVDVVDRFAYNGSGSGDIIQYTVEWDAKGTKTSLFKGTNGFLTTKSLDTSFDDIKNNLNQEAIGINSIEIQYNSWNYPEITINFTDIRGASLLASADFIHSDVLQDEKKDELTNNFANTFFSTFFRFPYPRYTLMVKGFYGRPVTYTLCVNDFKTKFNTSSGNFDVTVSFIGYMYGLLTDIPMRLLFAAPYCNYGNTNDTSREVGNEYWAKKVADGVFAYEEGTPMITFFDLSENLKCIEAKWKEMESVMKAVQEMKTYESKKASLDNIKGYYESFKSSFDDESDKPKHKLHTLDLSTYVNGTETQSRKYLILFTEAGAEIDGCDTCNGKGTIRECYTAPNGMSAFHDSECPTCHGSKTHKRKDTELDGVVMEDVVDTKAALYNSIHEFNLQPENSGSRISYIERITTSDEATKPLLGTIAYIKDEKKENSQLGYKEPKDNQSCFISVMPEDLDKVKEYLKASDTVGMVNTMANSTAVAVTVVRVDAFEKSVGTMLTNIDTNLDDLAKKVEEEQEGVYKQLLGFKVTLKNVINMCLAHLDTFMQCMYTCMDKIKSINRLFSDANLSKYESDVKSTTEGENRPTGSPLYLPPFFAFRKINPKSGEYEEAWIGDDSRFSDVNRFQEIQLIDGLLNGALKAQSMAKEQAEKKISKETGEILGDKIGENYIPTFINDYCMNQNPYKNYRNGSDNMLEKLIAMFAFRCMMATIYSVDFPDVSNRLKARNGGQKAKYFEQFAMNEATNFCMNKEEFDAFRKSSLPSVLSGYTWENFEAYITGKAENGGIINTERGHSYFAGGMANASPLFTKKGDDDYVLSYGIEGGDSGTSVYTVPLNFTSSSEAASISSDIYSKYKNNDESNPNLNGLGINRKYAMPTVVFEPNDSEFQAVTGEIINSFTKICSTSEGNNEFKNLGFYFKEANNWGKYFSGVVKGEHEHWFPGIFKIADVGGVRSANDSKDNGINEGNLYNGEAVSNSNKRIYGYAPTKATNLRDFFISNRTFWQWFTAKENEKNRVESSAGNDKYVESDVVPEMLSTPDTVTVVGFPCADGTLFESEFYLMQNAPVSNIGTLNGNLGKTYTDEEMKLYRKAFLFLHSLPTSEYGALSWVMRTLIKRTYTPSVTDFPLASALFIGALYWREKACGGRDADDILLVYNSVSGSAEYKKANAGQLVTYRDSSNRTNGERIRRPLHPIMIDETYENHGKKTEARMERMAYLEIIHKNVEEAFVKEEKSVARQLLAQFFNGAAIITSSMFGLWAPLILDKVVEPYQVMRSAEERYIGFWDMHSDVKKQFIDLFENWVKSDFSRIESELSLRKKDGSEFTIPELIDINQIINNEIFDNKGHAKKSFKGNVFNVTQDTRNTDAYNSFISSVFGDTFFKNHLRFGASKLCNSLFTFLRYDTEAVKSVNNILTSGCVVKIPFPRVMMTREMFSPDWQDERLSLKVDDSALKRGWEAFKRDILDAVTANTVQDELDAEALRTTPPASVSPEVKISLYTTLKNLHDKWLVATKREKYSFNNDKGRAPGQVSIGDNFFYINSFYEDVGNEITLNIEELPGEIDSIVQDVNSPSSFYSFMYNIASQARVQLLALPVFNNMASPDYVREMFSPIPYDELDTSKVYTESQYVFLYPEEASKHASPSTESRHEEERYKFADDSFTLVSEAGQPNVTDIPSTFSDTTKGGNIPVFGVTFAKQNQNFFKSVNVSMDSPKTTEVGLLNTFAIADKFNEGNTQVTALGQDLFPIYSNYSYECSVEMMGCACIMPLMYFQLNNMPMFKGTYIVYNVNHSISPGNMTTHFTGQRLSRFRKPRNENSLATAPNENGYGSIRGSGDHGYDDLIKGCYTSSGHKLENEIVYDNISKATGISDKAVLRAVEFAETHYTGGFFSGGKLKVYYDPWVAKNNGMAGEGLIVSTQFDESYKTPDTYDGNVGKISKAVESIGEDNASSCTINGAFGIPGACYSACGTSSLRDFFDTMGQTFSSQGTCFSNLLNSNEELKNALKNKEWSKFAKLYKGANGITTYGVYCPGDDANFKNYAKDLEAGYNEASGASSSNAPQPSCAMSEGQELHVNEAGFNPNASESEAYAMKHPFNNVTAAKSIASHCTGAYKTSVCPKPSWVKDYSATINKHAMKGDGTKPAKQSISRCATYVKIAMYDGGLECGSCNGGFCGPVLEKMGWEEIYRSKKGEPWSGKEIDSKWRPGDIVTIDAFGKHSVGHIAMWTGTNWCSDFMQATCITYGSDGPANWDLGAYHFWRYRNVTNM